MIVPSSKLLWVAGTLIVPLSAIAGAIPERAPLALGLLGFVIVAALYDAVRSSSSLHGLRFKSGGILRISRGRTGELDLIIDTGNTPPPSPVRIGMPMPRALATSQPEVVCRLAPGTSRLAWPVMALERGCHSITQLHLEIPSRWGLWDLRRSVPLDAEVRGYPDLFRDRAAVAAIFLNRSGLGSHAQRQMGKGRDFEKLREYIAGDSLEDIHWKATAKRGRPVTKVFQVERTQEVYVIVDYSRLSGRVCGTKLSITRSNPPKTPDTPEPSLEERFLDVSLRSALLVGVAAERQGDHFGLVTFADRVKSFLPAGSGASHFAACRESLYTLEPVSTSPDFEELAAFLRQRVRRRSLMLFLTSLDDPVVAESFVRGMDLLRNQHLLVVGMLRPEGVRPVFHNDAVEQLDELYGELAGHYRSQSLREVELTLRRRGVAFSLTDGAHLTTDLIRQYLAVKQRQAL